MLLVLGTRFLPVSRPRDIPLYPKSCLTTSHPNPVFRSFSWVNSIFTTSLRPISCLLLLPVPQWKTMLTPTLLLPSRILLPGIPPTSLHWYKTQKLVGPSPTKSDYADLSIIYFQFFTARSQLYKMYVIVFISNRPFSMYSLMCRSWQPWEGVLAGLVSPFIDYSLLAGKWLG